MISIVRMRRRCEEIAQGRAQSALISETCGRIKIEELSQTLSAVAFKPRLRTQRRQRATEVHGGTQRKKA
jgi:hypothetical protein